MSDGKDGHYHYNLATHQVGQPNFFSPKAASGDVRICLYPVDINKAVKREHCPSKPMGEEATEVRSESLISWCSTKSNWPSTWLTTTFNMPFLGLNLKGCHLV